MDKVPEIEKMIAKEVPVIEATMKRIDTEPVVSDVLANVDEIRKKELEKASSKENSFALNKEYQDG